MPEVPEVAGIVELIAQMCGAIVPMAGMPVQIKPQSGEASLVLDILVPYEARGAIIGKQGRTRLAMQYLAHVISRGQLGVYIEVID